MRRAAFTAGVAMVALYLGLAGWRHAAAHRAVWAEVAQARAQAGEAVQTATAADTRLSVLSAHSKALEADIESAHSRIEGLKYQLDIVIGTCRGRARPPTPIVPPKPRPEVPEL